MPDSNSRSSRPHEARGLRLRIAVRRMHRKAADFIAALAREGVVNRAAFYTHWAGNKWPKRQLVRVYEERLHMPLGWIHEGGGESVEDLREALSLLDKDANHPGLRPLLNFTSPFATPVWQANQLLQQPPPDSGKISTNRHIPILQNADIGRFLAGERPLYVSQLPILESLNPGPLAFGWTVPEHDLSMAGANGRSIPPGALIVIDPQATISPGRYVLAKPREKQGWMLRRYQAAFDFDATQPYLLVASNPSFEAIRVSDPSRWEIAGRAILIAESL
jgi:hypothetical protein